MTTALAGLSGILEAGLREGVATALSAAVLHEGRLVHASCHGTVPDGPGRDRPLGPDDLFDLASVTKVLATTTVAARLVADGRLDLDRPVAEVLPAFAARGKGAVTSRHLLAHSAGLVWSRHWFDAALADPVAGACFLPPERRPAPHALGAAFARGRALVTGAVLDEPLEAPPGTRWLYSDAGPIAMGLLAEAIAGAPLSVLARELVFRPLGLAATGFLDALGPPEGLAFAAGRGFAPTGACEHRHEVTVGAVNDDNAWAMGGVGGHAGLFSTATEVAAVGQAWLDALHGRRDGLLDPEVARAFAERQPPAGSERAVGWDTPSPGRSSFGTRLGQGGRAIGHLGHTGTSLWIDVDRAVVVALLTNRIHVTRDLAPIRAFRPRFHDAVAATLGL